MIIKIMIIKSRYLWNEFIILIIFINFCYKTFPYKYFAYV